MSLLSLSDFASENIHFMTAKLCVGVVCAGGGGEVARYLLTGLCGGTGS